MQTTSYVPPSASQDDLDKMWKEFEKYVQSALSAFYAQLSGPLQLPPLTRPIEVPPITPSGSVLRTIKAAVENARLIQEQGQAVNGNLSFGSPTDGTGNILGQWVQIESPGAPDTEFSITHQLGKIPTGFVVFIQDKAATIYKGDTAWTDTAIYLKSSAATVKATLFLVIS